MKNYSLVETVDQGLKTWLLIDDDGNPVPAFSMFSKALLKRSPHNTRKSYCLHLARFIDYIAEAQKIHLDWNQKMLAMVVDAYPDWLMLGESSGDLIANKIAISYPSPKNGRSSSIVAVAAIKMFLSLSEKIREELEEHSIAGLSEESPAPEPLFPSIGKKTVLPSGIARKIQSKSMLGGVLAGGPKLIKYWVLPSGISVVPIFDQDRAMPFNMIPDLVDALRTSRDKALYAFCAASGCRLHEALQMLWDDIDFAGRTVRLVDPHTRPNNDSYLFLTPSERNLLAWKGRSCSVTLLLNPFADLFFHHLEDYLKNEYVDHGSHRFVFQILKGKQVGCPLFLSSGASRTEIFNLAATKVGIHGLGAHSLRHMYGTFMVNYFPNANGGRGLPMEQVQKLMGHRTLASTQKYAKHDEQLLAAALQTLPGLPDGSISLGMEILEIKREMLERALIEVNGQIRSETILLEDKGSGK